MDEEGVVATGMVGRAATGANAATEDDWHLQPAVAHVLNLGGLVEKLAKSVEREVKKHVVDDRSRADHRGAGAQSGEAALGDRRIAQPLRSIEFKQSGRRIEVAASRANPLADNEDCWIPRHLLR